MLEDKSEVIMIEISENKRKLAFWILLGIVGLLILVMTDLSLMIFTGFIIGCSLLPLVEKLSKKMNRVLATTIVMLITIFLVIICIVPIISLAGVEIQGFIEDIPTKTEQVNKFLDTVNIMGVNLGEYVNTTPSATKIDEIFTTIVEKSMNFTSAIVEFITISFAIGMIVFYFLAENESLEKKLIKLFPPKYSKKAREIFDLIKQRVGGYVIAQGSSMLAVGVVTFIGLAILGVKFSLLLGLIAGILDIVPVVGPVIACLLGIIVSIHNGWLMIIGVIVVYIVAQWISNNAVRPFIFAKFLDLHPLTIIIAFLIAAKFLGGWGVIIAPALASVVTTLIDELYIKPMHKEK